ncbi:hypothetical protein BASA81_006100 [Batrachochytrium salamandrivorans]|nr:hypothetical protein BASA81_006100 [Batrachochytrium salamandrivorans]
MDPSQQQQQQQQPGQQQPQLPTTPVAVPPPLQQHRPSQGYAYPPYAQAPPSYQYGFAYAPPPPYAYSPNYAYAHSSMPHMPHMQQQHNPQQPMSSNPLPASPAAGQPTPKRERKPLAIVNPKTKEAVVPQAPAPVPAAVPAVVAPQAEVVAPSPKLGPSPADEMRAKAFEAKSKPSPAIKAAVVPVQQTSMPEMSLTSPPVAVVTAPTIAPPVVTTIPTTTPDVAAVTLPLESTPPPAQKSAWGKPPIAVLLPATAPVVAAPKPQQQPVASKQQQSKDTRGKQSAGARGSQQPTAASLVAGGVGANKQQPAKQRPNIAPIDSVPAAAVRATSPVPMATAPAGPPVVTAASLAAKPAPVPAPKSTPSPAPPTVATATSKPPPQAVAKASPPPEVVAPSPAAVTPSLTPPVAAPEVKKTSPPLTWVEKRAATVAAPVEPVAVLPPAVVAAPPALATASNKKPAKICLSRETILEYRECAVALSELEDWPEDRYGFPLAVVRSRNFPTAKSAPPRVGAPPTVDWRSSNNTPSPVPSSFMDEPLKLSENAWKRPTEALDEASQSLKALRGMLNKLTKENAAALTDQVLGIRVISKDMLENVIREIFSKALREPHFNSVYAQLCKDINERSAGEWAFLGTVERDSKWFWTSTTEADDDSALEGPLGKYEPGAEGFSTKQEALEAAKKQTGFKRMLLNNCQSEFEKNSLEGVDEQLRQAEQEEGGETKLRHIAELEALRKKTKQRVLGNIAFIGELFLKKMLSGRIINTCVHHLLGKALDNPTEFLKTSSVQPEDIECLHQLFTKVGKEMDSAELGRENINQYFSFFALAEKSKTLPPRYNFMILDLLELRQNNWQVRRQTETVSTKEDILAQANNDQFNRSNPRSHGGGGGGGGRGPRDNSNNGNQSRTQQASSARFSQNATTSHGSAPKASKPVTANATTKPTPAAVAPSTTPAAAVVALSPAETKKKVDFIFKEFASNGEVAYFVDEVKLYYSSELAQLVAQAWVDAFLSKGDVKLLALLSALSAAAVGDEVLDAVLGLVVNSCAVLADVKIDVPKAPTNLAHIFKYCLDSELWTKAAVEQALGEVVAEWRNTEDEYSASSNADSAESLRTAMEAVLANDEWTKLLTL